MADDSKERDDYAKEIAAGVSGYAPKPGSLPTPTIQAPQSVGVPLRNALSQADIDASVNQERDDKNGLNVAAYNAQRRDYDRAQGLPVTEPANAGNGVVRAQPTAAPVQQAAPAVGGQGPGMGLLNATYAAQERGVRDQTSAQMAANDAQTVGDAQVGQLQREQADATAARAKEQADASARQLDEIHRLSDEAASKQIDPMRFWHNQGAGERVAYTIASMLGGFAAGWTHGPNQALEQINRNIDQDIGAQRMAIEQAHGKVTDAKGILGEMYTRFGNIDKAEAATKMLQINSAINDTKAQVAAANSPGLAANGQIAIAALEREKLLAQQRFLAAGQAKGLDFGKLHELSKDLEADRSVAGEQALNNLGQMDKTGQGDIPGTSLGGRILGSLAEPDEHGRRGFVAGLANAARGTEARQASGAMYQAAEASLPPSIRGSPEAVKNQMAALFGSGSPEDVKAGMDRARSLIGGQRANAYAGQKPETVQAYEALDHAYNRRSAPKPGLPGGSTP